MSGQSRALKEGGGLGQALKRFFSNDSMSVALFSLFLVCLAAQALTGWFAFNHDLRSAHFPQIGFSTYLGTGTFLDGVFSNWQAAILQLAVLISFGSVLRQRGAPHSKKGEGASHRKLSLRLTLKPTVGEWLRCNGLALTFFAMFVATFACHALFGSWKHNEDQMLRGLAASSFSAYASSSSFWFSVFQCWEAEFAAIGVYIVLSIFLRQEGSPESKPVDAGDKETGETNS
ncbi:MAG: DUF6766 family protein [Caulobacteraceae bacterium]